MRVTRYAAALAACAFVLMLSGRAVACVGKTLRVAVLASEEEKILTRMLSIMVNERTGTSVKIREYASFEDMFTALEKDEADIVVTWAGQAFAEVVKKKQARSTAALMEEGQSTFNQRYNLIWLEPWGATDGGRFVLGEGGAPLATPAVPVVRKETLKEFPALSRLINKMSGRLDARIMSDLVKQARGSDPDSAARDFLKSSKLI